MESLPRNTMEKLLKVAGAKRLSESAKDNLKNLLINKLDEISKKSIIFSKHAGRKTIKKEDILIAIEK